MSRREEVKRRLLAEWLRKAEADLAVAVHLLSAGKAEASVAEDISVPDHPVPTELDYANAVAFHCQQAAEKYLKAFLTWQAIEFPKTHDLDQLLDLVQTVDEQLADSLRDVIVLTPYGVELRYPGDRPDANVEQARQAVELVWEVQMAIQSAVEMS